jgi:hypothetical protein
MTRPVESSRSPAVPNIETKLLLIQDIRRDGGTQARSCLNVEVVREYSRLLASGVRFPPVRVWFDRQCYWRSDGFHRVAAAELLGWSEFLADVLAGGLPEAVWDGLAANSSHGLRRTRLDTEIVIRRALEHPMGLHLSNHLVARHIGIPEATVRRWRNRILASSPNGEDAVRMASRNGKTYEIHTARIGRQTRGKSESRKSRAGLQIELSDMKQLGSKDAKRILQLIENWMFGAVGADALLPALERLIRTWVGR